MNELIGAILKTKALIKEKCCHDDNDAQKQMQEAAAKMVAALKDYQSF